MGSINNFFSVLWANGLTVYLTFAGQVAIVCVINFIVGYKLLKWVAIAKGAK